MDKIPFDINLLGKDYEVYTRSGKKVSIISTDEVMGKPILAKVYTDDTFNVYQTVDYYTNGLYIGPTWKSDLDLFLVKKELNLNDFERLYITSKTSTKIEDIPKNVLAEYRIQAAGLLLHAKKYLRSQETSKDRFMLRRLFGILYDVRNQCQTTSDIILLNKVIEWLKTSFNVQEDEKA